MRSWGSVGRASVCVCVCGDWILCQVYFVEVTSGVNVLLMSLHLSNLQTTHAFIQPSVVKTTDALETTTLGLCNA